jgi:opacity protein-like surface antigen
VARALQFPRDIRNDAATGESTMSNGNFTATCVIALLMSTAARADDSGPYVGASMGKATQSSIGFDGEDISFRLLGGYSFNKFIAIEAGYVDGGEQKDRRGPLKLSVKSDGFFGTVLARWPLGDVVAPYAKAGFVAYDSTSTVSNGTISVSESESDGDLLYGGGLEFKFGEHVRLRTDYEKVRVPDAAFDIYSVVFAYVF